MKMAYRTPFLVLLLVASILGACSKSTNTNGTNGDNHDPDHEIILWDYYIPQGVGLSSPAIGYDGTIYVGGDQQNIYAISPLGTLKWEYPTTNRIKAAIVVGPDSTIYILPDDEPLSALSPSGECLWQFPILGERASPAIDSDGIIYVSGDSTFYSLSPGGSINWQYKANGEIVTPPVIDSEGMIYFGDLDSTLTKVNKFGGLQWKRKLNGVFLFAMALGPDGTLYTGAQMDSFYAINPDGSTLWTIGDPAEIWSCPSIGPDGTIYVGRYHIIMAINPDGTKRWSEEFTELVIAAPYISADGVMYYSVGGYLYSFDYNGSIIMEHELSRDYTSTASMTYLPNGTLVIPICWRGLFAVSINTIYPAPDCWSQYQGNSQNTGTIIFP